jgi:hypothetical protein
MRLDYTILIYILVVIAILFILLKNDYKFIHSFIFSLVIGLLLLIIIKPPNDVSVECDDISSIAIYFAIIFISSITILIYSAVMSYKNF